MSQGATRFHTRYSLALIESREENCLRTVPTCPFCAERCPLGAKMAVFGAPVIQRVRGSEIVIGDGVELRSSLQSNPLAPNHPVILATRTSHATIRIGNDCGLTAATIVAAERVELGERVLVGANATIVDTDFHPLDPVARRERHAPGRHAAVRIEDDVFIGMNSIILKGTTLGAGCVVGAGERCVWLIFGRHGRRWEPGTGGKGG
jgi:acetyltransferase-like isoleucine patch superfamily enzyme